MEELSKEDLSHLLNEQSAYDVDFFDREYEPLSEGDQALRHILEHVNNIGKKLGDYYFGEHRSLEQITKEVIPDLFINHLRLANRLGFNVEARVERKPRDFHGMAWQLHRACGFIGHYLERLEHGEESERWPLYHAVIILSHSARWLAAEFNVDLAEAVRLRNGQLAEEFSSGERR